MPSLLGEAASPRRRRQRLPRRQTNASYGRRRRGKGGYELRLPRLRRQLPAYNEESASRAPPAHARGQIAAEGTKRLLEAWRSKDAPRRSRSFGDHRRQSRSAEFSASQEKAHVGHKS
ncbi:unnamed protein product [Ixodes persulcatus]